MSKMTFSLDQEKAIQAKGVNYLISAGAGSGKTAVLTERIYRLAKESKTLDNFLVLTFTNLAAGEMKDRVRKKLLEDQDTISLASEVDNAHIETFDSFSLYLVKKYFYKLGLSKDINIVDNAILSIKRRNILDEVFEELLDANDQDFLNLIDTYVAKNEKEIKDFVIKVLEKGDKVIDNFGYFDNLESHFKDDNYAKYLVSELHQEYIDKLHFLRNLAENIDNGDYANVVCDFIDGLLEHKDYDSFYSVISDKQLSSFPNKKGYEFLDPNYRERIVNFYNKKIKANKDLDFGYSEDIIRQYNGIRKFGMTIIRIVKMVETRLNLFKKEKNAYSFGDISRFVIKLIEDENIRKEISDSFDYIMVDEYQDTSENQDRVISAISKNNVYMVGDVKQSIYRFRGADCTLFQNKYNDYKAHKGGEEIDLNTSYRSREEVVNFINDLFKQLMTLDKGQIDYLNGHIFGYGRKEYKDAKTVGSNYSPEIYTYKFENSDQAEQTEIKMIINDIKTKINEGYLVYDNELKDNRKCDYKDFAIIIDRGTEFDEYRRAFSDANIPLNAVDKETLFKSEVLLVVKNIFKMLQYSLNNEYEGEYRHAFFSVARSFLFSYKDGKLYELFKNNGYLTDPVAHKIELMKESLRFASLKTILTRIYEEYDIYASLSKITQYYSNAHKLEKLLSLAESMDALGYTREDFVKFLNELDERDFDVDYQDNLAASNSVTLINIHKSKGLEYPIIYYPLLYKAFNRRDVTSKYNFTERYGINLPSPKEDKFSLVGHLIKREIIRSDFEEKVRLLYVALTRAKEKIILFRGEKDKEKNFYLPFDSACMSDILALSDIRDNYPNSYHENIQVKENDNKAKEVPSIIFKEVKVDAKVVVKTRASKKDDNDVDKSLLNFGSELHAYLEKMDVESKDVSYVKNRQMRKYVYNVVNSSLFNNVKNEMIRHEFHFFDLEDNIDGYIDCLVIKDNEVDIIDFKLKHIDDSEYEKQLRIYKSYINKITDKPVKMYLLAAITGEIKEVKDE